jgi:hypothetical protein
VQELDRVLDCDDVRPRCSGAAARDVGDVLERARRENVGDRTTSFKKFVVVGTKTSVEPEPSS